MMDNFDAANNTAILRAGTDKYFPDDNIKSRKDGENRVKRVGSHGLVEPFIYGRLVKRLDPHYVFSRCEADMIAYPMDKNSDTHYLFDLHTNGGQQVAHDLLMQRNTSIGYLSSKQNRGKKLTPHYFDEPVTFDEGFLNMLRDSDNDALIEASVGWAENPFDITITGQIRGLDCGWAYLLDKQGWCKGVLRPLTDAGKLTKGDYPVDLDAHYMVDGFMADRFASTIEPNVQYRIGVYNSIMTELEHTNISLSKEMLLHSPILKDGATFTFPKSPLTNGIAHSVKITTWVEHAPLGLDEQTIYMWVQVFGPPDKNSTVADGRKRGGLLDWFFFFFDVDELPDRLNETTIARFFKQMQFKNKDREARHRAWVCEKFGFFNVDNSPYGDPTELRYQVQLAFINHAVMARNYTKVVTGEKHATKKERSSCEQVFSLVLKLICAYADPTLRGELKRVKAQRTRQVTRKSQKRVKAPREWKWGNDRVCYIAPHGEGNKMTTRFFTRSTLGTRYVNDVEKYKREIQYELEEPINGRTHAALVYIRGHWKGEGEEGDIPEYFVGRPPRQISRVAIAWLKRVAKEEGIYIQHADNGGEVSIMGTPYRVDGYCKETDTIYEFHGDYWHGNPAVYDRDVVRNGRTMGEWYDNTIERENVLRSMCSNLVVMWESDWREIA